MIVAPCKKGGAMAILYKASMMVIQPQSSRIPELHLNAMFMNKGASTGAM